MTLTVALDFNGVMNQYPGWGGSEELYEPREGLKEFLEDLRDSNYDLVLTGQSFATIDRRFQVFRWLMDHDLPDIPLAVEKPTALCLVDDRAIRFDGDFTKTRAEISRFRKNELPYWKTS